MNIRSLAPYALVSLAFGLVVLSVYGSHGYLHLRELESELSSINQKNARFESEIAAMDSQIQALKEDPMAVEKRAREELGYSKAGEIVYVFSPPSSHQRSSTLRSVPARN